MPGTSYRHGPFSSLSLTAFDLCPVAGWMSADTRIFHADPSPNRYRNPAPHFHADDCPHYDVASHTHAASRRAHHQRGPRL